MSDINQKLETTLALLRATAERLNSIESRIEPQKQWLTKHDAATLLNISTTTLAEWRQQIQWEDGSFPWQRGIHYVQQPGKSGQFEYNRILLEDWRLNRQDWKAHQRAIDAWVSSIAAPSRRTRKAS